jgi:hypothetical protein
MRIYKKNKKQFKIANLYTSLAVILTTAFVANVAVAQKCGTVTTKSFTPGQLLYRKDGQGARTSFFKEGCWIVPGSPAVVYDISNPQAPRVAKQINAPWSNGHMWFMAGNYARKVEWGGPTFGGGVIDFSNLPDVSSTGNAMFSGVNLNSLGTLTISGYPYSNKLWSADLISKSGINAGTKVAIGNLFLQIPTEQNQTSMAVFDAGDPNNVRLLDVISDGGIRMYTEQLHVYKHHAMFANGGGTVTGIDFSNPSDLKISYKIPAAGNARYMAFQDNYMFQVRFGSGAKTNMDTKQVVTNINGMNTEDFFPIPVGHLLVNSSAHGSNEGEIAISAHAASPDTNPPYVGFQNPSPNQTNVPVTSRIGFVINETLESNTLNDTTILVQPIGGAPVKGLVSIIHTGIVNFGPHQPLQANTTYEVTLVGNGIKDVAGNGIREYKFRFSTGASIQGGGNNPTATPTVAVPTSTPVVAQPTATRIPPTNTPRTETPNTPVPTIMPTRTLAPVATARPTIPGTVSGIGEAVDLSTKIYSELRGLRRVIRSEDSSALSKTITSISSLLDQLRSKAQSTSALSTVSVSSIDSIKSEIAKISSGKDTKEMSAFARNAKRLYRPVKSAIRRAARSSR